MFQHHALCTDLSRHGPVGSVAAAVAVALAAVAQPARAQDVPAEPAAELAEVLGVSATANGTQIADACAVLRVLIDPTNEPPGVSFATAARFKDLCRLLDEIEATLIDTGRRARYDGMRRRR